MSLSGKRWTTALLYAAAVSMAGWAVFDMTGPTGLKIYAAAALGALGGLRPLGILALYGAGEVPMSSWFTGERPGDESDGQVHDPLGRNRPPNYRKPKPPLGAG